MPRRRRKREGPEFEDIAVWVSGRAGQCCLCQRPTDEGELIRPEGEGKARCLRCAGLEGLMYVHPGDPALTRRARRFSTRQAVILQSWSGRVLRHGILAEPDAVAKAQQACAKDAPARARQKVWRQERWAAARERYVGRFTEAVATLYPGCPAHEAQAIAVRAQEKLGGVTPNGRPRKVNVNAVAKLVAEHVRLTHTPFEQLLAEGMFRGDAAAQVADAVVDIVSRWAVGARPYVAPRGR